MVRGYRNFTMAHDIWALPAATLAQNDLYPNSIIVRKKKLGLLRVPSLLPPSSPDAATRATVMAMSASSAPWPPSSTPPPPLPLPLPSPPPPPSPLPFGGGGGAPGDPSVCGAPPEFACHADRWASLHAVSPSRLLPSWLPQHSRSRIWCLARRGTTVHPTLAHAALRRLPSSRAPTLCSLELRPHQATPQRCLSRALPCPKEETLADQCGARLRPVVGRQLRN
jgi:hypothetical protein